LGCYFMARLPKLRVKRDAWNNTEEIMEFEKARDFPYGAEIIIAVEGHQINSYDDLLKLVQNNKLKRKRMLEVLFIPMISGG